MVFRPITEIDVCSEQCDLVVLCASISLLQIIFANVTNQEKTPITLEGVSAPLEVIFTYSVRWHKTEYVAAFALIYTVYGKKTSRAFSIVT